MASTQSVPQRIAGSRAMIVRADLLECGNQGGGDVTAAQVFSERGSDLPRNDVVRRLVSIRYGRPCDVAAMHINIGIERMKLVREAYSAALRALAFSSSVAGTMPRIFFWFGQMMPQTFSSMMVPSQAPMPMTTVW